MSVVTVATQGTALMKGDGADPEVFTEVTQITEYQEIDNGSTTEIDVTTMGSTTKETRLGLSDPGELSFSGVFDPSGASHQGMIADKASKVVRNWRIEYTDGATEEFSATVKTFTRQSGVDDVLRFQSVLRLTGPIVFTPAP